jgi:hypothetical protein
MHERKTKQKEEAGGSWSQISLPEIIEEVLGSSSYCALPLKNMHNYEVATPPGGFSIFVKSKRLRMGHVSDQEKYSRGQRSGTRDGIYIRVGSALPY